MKAKVRDFQLDFIGIGAGRSGSTWLARMLAAHPGIFIPPQKELYYFNKTLGPINDRPLSWYAAFFRKAKEHQLKGEITPRYLIDKSAAKAIYRFNPDIKIIVVLRHPVDRLFSKYLWRLNQGEFNWVSFEKAISLRKIVPSNSLYYMHLKRYFDLFPRENIKIGFFEDFINNRISYLKDFQSFLNVNPFIPQIINERVNVSRDPRFFHITMTLRRLQVVLRNKNLTSDNLWVLKYFSPFIIKPYEFFKINTAKAYEQKPQINERLKKKLQSYYLKDIENLERFLGKDLSHWKK